MMSSTGRLFRCLAFLLCGLSVVGGSTAIQARGLARTASVPVLPLGAVWQLATAAPGRPAASISCAADGQCVLVGNWNSAAVSVSAGADWTARRVPNPEVLTGLLGVSCEGARCVLVGGDSGAHTGAHNLIAVSENGGADWTLRPSGMFDMLDAVSCTPAGTCLAVGGRSLHTSYAHIDGPGIIVRSTDGGGTWAVRPSGSAAVLYGVSCDGAGGCVAVGAGGTVLQSTDDGATWLRRPVPTAMDIVSVACQQDKACAAVGVHGTVLTSADGGTTWTSAATPTGAALVSVSCTAGDACVAVGYQLAGLSSQGVVIYRERAGGSWLRGDAGPVTGLRSVSCTPAFCLTVSEDGAVYATHGSTVTGTAVIFLQGVCSALPDPGGVDGAIFQLLRQKMIDSYGYRPDQFLNYSYAGGAMKQQGSTWVWQPSPYNNMIPISQDYQTKSWSALDSMLAAYHAHYPKSKFILVGHSLGGVVAFEELVKQKGMYGSIAKVVTLDSPLDGVAANVVADSAILAATYGVPKCAILGPAATLLATTHNLASNTVTLRNVVNTAQARHIQVVTAGNQHDGLLQPRECGIAVDGDINSQWVGGASVLKFNLRRPGTAPWTCVNETHSAALSDPSAISQLAQAIGPDMNANVTSATAGRPSLGKAMPSPTASVAKEDVPLATIFDCDSRETTNVCTVRSGQRVSLGWVYYDYDCDLASYRIAYLRDDGFTGVAASGTFYAPGNCAGGTGVLVRLGCNGSSCRINHFTLTLVLVDSDGNTSVPKRAYLTVLGT